jgi:hypothetical protein
MTTEQKQSRLWALQQSIKEHEMTKVDLQTKAKGHVIYYEPAQLLATAQAMMANEKLLSDLKFEFNYLLQDVERESLEVVI